MSTMTEQVAIPAGGTSTPPPARAKERLLSLDVFRGITLAAMTLVNNPGDERFGYPPLLHAKWHGWTPTDLIFPFFLFIVGVAIPYAFAGRLDRGESKGELYTHVLGRAVILFALGLFLNGFPWFHLSTIRILGILQRIALCYLFASVIYLNVKSRGQAVIMATLLTFYFIMLKFVPVPGHGAGILERDGNWVQYIDVHLLPGHLQHGNWEGKGLLSTLPAIANTLIGVLVGQYLRSSRPALEKIAQFFLIGNVGMFLGLLWSIWFPINQNLWTSSLVVFMCGMALVIFAFCYYLVDVKKVTWWTKPFVIFGVNSLTVWMGTSLLRMTLDEIKLAQAGGTVVSLWTLIYSHVFASWAGPLHGSELFAFAYLMLWLAILTLMYKKRIFIKV